MIGFGVAPGSVGFGGYLSGEILEVLTCFVIFISGVGGKIIVSPGVACVTTGPLFFG